MKTTWKLIVIPRPIIRLIFLIWQLLLWLRCARKRVSLCEGQINFNEHSIKQQPSWSILIGYQCWICHLTVNYTARNIHLFVPVITYSGLFYWSILLFLIMVKIAIRQWSRTNNWTSLSSGSGFWSFAMATVNTSFYFRSD